MPEITAADQALITTFGRLLEAHARLGRHLGHSLEREADLPHTWFEVLLRMSRAEAGRITMSALAQQVALTGGGITKMIDRMVRAGLVQRVPCPTDRRVSYATLTSAGQDALERALPGHARNLRQAFSDFTEQDLCTLDELLDRLRAVDLTLSITGAG